MGPAKVEDANIPMNGTPESFRTPPGIASFDFGYRMNLLPDTLSKGWVSGRKVPVPSTAVRLWRQTCERVRIATEPSVFALRPHALIPGRGAGGIVTPASWHA